MGGQVGDIGTIVGDGFEIEVTDTKKKLDGLWVHVCKMLNGSVRKVLLQVSASTRKTVTPLRPTIRLPTCCTMRFRKSSALP